MTKQEVNAAIRQGKLSTTTDWYGGFLVVFYCVCLSAASSILIFYETTALSYRVGLILFPASGVLSFYALYSLLKERKLTFIETSLNAAENRKLALAAFQSLGWNIAQNSSHVILANIGARWVGIPVHATALLINGAIHLNLMNGGGNVKGRAPFSFGKNDQKLRLLISEINKSRQPTN